MTIYTYRLCRKLMIVALLVNLISCFGPIKKVLKQDDQVAQTEQINPDTNVEPTLDINDSLSQDNKLSTNQAKHSNPNDKDLNRENLSASNLTENHHAKHVGDLWDRLRIGFEFSDIHVDNKKAEKRINYHRQRLLKTPTLIKRVTDNAAPYFYYILSQLEQNNLPLEIAILPIIESHFDAFAYSPSRASGLWQFIPSTGKRFGLNQDWWHDERRDTIAATGAAIQYLLYLNKMFDGDWLLAMASYNAGQGTVLKAIKKNRKLGKPTDYWSLDLPKETQHYIPKLLAWRDIIKEPTHYNINFHPIPDEPTFEIVDIGSQIDLAQVADLAQVDIDTIYQLNPAYNRWATDPSPPHDLLIPVEKVATLKKELTNLPAQERIAWRKYIIKRNDSLSKIAVKYNSSVDLIAKINGIKNGRIVSGKALMIPSASKNAKYYIKSAEQRLAKRQERPPSKEANKITHRVKTGESLWSIAKKYKVKTTSLARWNNMAPKDTLSVNRSLTIWTKTTKNLNNQATIKNETRKLFYKVKKGDSLDAIANRFKVTTNDIKTWNKDAQKKYIQPGQLLTLYVALTDRELTIN